MHAIHAARLVQMPSKKKKRSCPFSSATARQRKPKKSFSSDWAENLAGSYFSTSTFSARRSKIPENYGWRTSWRSGKRKHWNMAKVPAGEDQRIRELSLLSRKRWTCGKCTNLGPLGYFSARTIAVRRTKLILHFRRRKKAGRSQ